jgi:hypothetical protein
VPEVWPVHDDIRARRLLGLTLMIYRYRQQSDQPAREGDR